MKFRKKLFLNDVACGLMHTIIYIRTNFHSQLKIGHYKIKIPTARSAIKGRKKQRQSPLKSPFSPGLIRAFFEMRAKKKSRVLLQPIFNGCKADNKKLLGRKNFTDFRPGIAGQWVSFEKNIV